jgi:hypothetical protein
VSGSARHSSNGGYRIHVKLDSLSKNEQKVDLLGESKPRSRA